MGAVLKEAKEPQKQRQVSRSCAVGVERFKRSPRSDIAINAVVKNGLNPAVSRPAWVE